MIAEKSWSNALREEFNKDYFQALERFLDEEEQAHTVYPPKDMRFNALNLTPLDEVKVVIIGQDPYHGKGQANGLAFSVEDGIRIPPSLRNIFKELNSDIGCEVPKNGDLRGWAEQGVLLLNKVLTVREGQANSHKNKGWEKFTDAVINLIEQQDRRIVYILWGSSAQAAEKLIRNPEHKIIKSPHPSPLSSYMGFFGSKPFSKCNELLGEDIDWSHFSNPRLKSWNCPKATT